jgi:hypothetical protein
MLIRGLVIAISLMAMGSASQAASAAMAQKRVLQQEIASLVKANDFQRLSDRAAIERRSEARFADGLWRLSLMHAYFQQELSRTTKTDADWKRVLDRLHKQGEHWAVDWIFYVEAVHSLAWQTRGSGFAHQVTPKAMARFKELLRHARDVLDQHKEELQTEPLWYSRRMTIALELGESAESQEALFEEAIRAHPRYHGIYFARVRALEPIWGGSVSAQMALLDRLSTLKGPAVEEGIYARVLWTLAHEAFGDARMHSKSMRDAIKAIVNLYPDEWNLQAMFLFACTASDKALAAQMLPRLPERYIGEMDIADEGIFSSCKDWASGREPAFIMRKRKRDGSYADVLVR